MSHFFFLKGLSILPSLLSDGHVSHPFLCDCDLGLSAQRTVRRTIKMEHTTLLIPNLFKQIY